VEKKMLPEDTLVQYTRFHKHARTLQSKYKDQIRLLVGIETEWIRYPQTFEEYQRLISEYPVDYVVGSVHHLHGVPIDFDQQHIHTLLTLHYNNNVQSMVMDYFVKLYEMIEHVRPHVIAHFDLILLFGNSDLELGQDIWQQIDRILELVYGYGGIIEINSRGIKKMGRVYPRYDILQVRVVNLF
jgi:histidinol-phosphatase (PHP family)